jgi:transposase
MVSYRFCRTGAPCRALLTAFGNWNSVWRQFRHWRESGVWDVVLQGLADSRDEWDTLQMNYSATIWAHRCAAGEKEGFNSRRLIVLAAGWQPRAIFAAME